jgi:hypothetical protein
LANKKEGKKTDEKKSTVKDLLKDMQSGEAYKKNRKSIRDRNGGRDMMAAGLAEAKEKHQQKLLAQQLAQSQ